jgi:hypothetical protein
MCVHSDGLGQARHVRWTGCARGICPYAQLRDHHSPIEHARVASACLNVWTMDVFYGLVFRSTAAPTFSIGHHTPKCI